MIDMLNTSELNLFNSKKLISDLEKEILRSNPRIFLNSFTQGADTTRSLSNFWTGINLGSNGVYHTGDSPNIYLIKDDFLQIFHKNDFKINIYTSLYKRFSLPPNYEEYSAVNKSENIDEFLSELALTLKTHENTLTYIDIHDYHWSIDDYGANQKGISKGLEESFLTLNKIDNKIDNLIDFKIVFSDHGHLYTGQIESQRNIEKYVLDDSRIKTLFSISQRSSNKITFDSRLTSLIDVFPSLIDFANLEYDISDLDGFSVFKNESHKFLFSENSYSLYRNKDLSIDTWKIISLDGFYQIDRYNKETKQGQIDIILAMDYLLKNSLSYKNHALEKTQKRKFNSAIELDISSKYTSGNSRLKSRKILTLLRYLLPYNNKVTSFIRLQLKKLRDIFFR